MNGFGLWCFSFGYFKSSGRLFELVIIFLLKSIKWVGLQVRLYLSISCPYELKLALILDLAIKIALKLVSYSSALKQLKEV